MKMYEFVKSAKNDSTFKIKSLNGKMLFTGDKVATMDALLGTDIVIKYGAVKGTTYTLTTDFNVK